ncbi:hypothetical protein L6452_06420 [Arctium lappa]|uniref:Uncharacterized protein n=1 Tax=Arctium lappa TaxID=4217 RepID=A0ACB9EJS7_ARCLA|nr:hypothetical protein L6452_06420 [Arctium lappa]
MKQQSVFASDKFGGEQAICGCRLLEKEMNAILSGVITTKHHQRDGMARERVMTVINKLMPESQNGASIRYCSCYIIRNWNLFAFGTYLVANNDSDDMIRRALDLGVNVKMITDLVTSKLYSKLTKPENVRVKSESMFEFLYLTWNKGSTGDRERNRSPSRNGNGHVTFIFFARPTCRSRLPLYRSMN